MSTPRNRRDLVGLPGASRADRIGQGTAVEQSRAQAEVAAAVLAADARPRDEEAAVRRRDALCSRLRTAEGAFYSYRRGGQTITGPNVHLARDLATAWGNVQFGITELRRDDDYGQSEMQAWAWELETNTRVTNTFIVPHVRHSDKGATVTDLTDPRDIYENNANAGARRLRECILDILPRWYTEGAVDRCHRTLREQSDSQPLPERRTNVLRLFDEQGVSEGRLVASRGKPVASWTETDIAQLAVAYRTIERGEGDADDLFPRVDEVPVTDAAATAAASGAAPRPRGKRPENPPTVKPEQPATEQPAAAAAEQTPAAGNQQEAPQPAGAAPKVNPQNLPKPGTRAWHAARHPVAADGGTVILVDQDKTGECGYCDGPAA